MSTTRKRPRTGISIVTASVAGLGDTDSDSNDLLLFGINSANLLEAQGKKSVPVMAGT
jgi:hypothetical protein